MKETYLGDGVYATFDGYYVWLDCRGQPSLTEGPSGKPSIGLEPDVIVKLFAFFEKCGKEKANQPA